MTDFITTYGGPIMMDVRYRREYLGEKNVLASRHIPNFAQAGIRTFVLPVDNMDELKHFYCEMAESGSTIRLAESPADLESPAKDGISTFTLCGSFAVIGDKLDMLPMLKKLGMNVFSLTLNRRNLIADGCTERTQSGLSYFGVSLIKQLAASGIIIDVSHASDAAFDDVLETTPVPIIASHSNCRAVCDNARNLTDEQIKALAARGGLIGLSMHPTMVAVPNPTAESVLDHLSHVIELVGVDHVAIGTDYINYVVDFFRSKLIAGDPSGTLYGKGDHVYPTGIETVSKSAVLYTLMRQRGLSESDVAKVTRGNFIRVWKEVSAQAA